MARRKIQIKKIENIAARQVTFSKRRRGVFKKAQELSILCDAEIALIVFSATGRLSEFASSSVEQVLERRILLSQEQEELDQPSTELQLEGRNYAMLRKISKEKTEELRWLNGEELQKLTLRELQKLEDLLNTRLTCVNKAKDERILTEISNSKEKGVKLTEENRLLEQVITNFHG